MMIKPFVVSALILKAMDRGATYITPRNSHASGRRSGHAPIRTCMRYTLFVISSCENVKVFHLEMKSSMLAVKVSVFFQ